jgi:putative flippase GtrA
VIPTKLNPFERFLAALENPQTRARILRWFAAGLAFMGINTLILYGLVGLGGLAVPVATLVAAETCTLLRFLVNHYWVFRLRQPTWGNLASYHVANAGAFVVWWLSANLLTLFGMHYLLANVAAVGASTLLSLWTNFLWIWRRRHHHD